MYSGIVFGLEIVKEKFQTQFISVLETSRSQIYCCCL